MICLKSASSAEALVFYLPFSGPCTQRWKNQRERPESGIYFEILEKKTQYLMNTLFLRCKILYTQSIIIRMKGYLYSMIFTKSRLKTVDTGCSLNIVFYQRS